MYMYSSFEVNKKQNNFQINWQIKQNSYLFIYVFPEVKKEFICSKGGSVLVAKICFDTMFIND